MILPRISIVTPSYNQGEFLEECIDSVLSQNYPNLEYVIMDGGSSDNSVEIIKKYAKYLTYWQSRPDKGQYDAINEGFKRTTGDIMAWLNSDDKYHHHAFFKAAYIFTNHEHVEWITGRISAWNSNGEPSIIGEHLPLFSRERYLKKNYMDPFIQQESTFWRRSLWTRTGGRLRADLALAGDIELWMRFFRFTQLYTVDALLGGYRIHGNQRAYLFRSRYFEEADMVLDKEIESFKNGEYKYVPPAPAPLRLPHLDLRTFIDDIYSSHRQPIFKISDDTDAVNYFLLNRLKGNSEDLIKKALVIILRKLGLYKFYMRNERYFSRTYYFFRNFFAADGKK